MALGQITHVENTLLEFTDTTNLTAEQVEKEKRTSYLIAVAREKAGYEQRLVGAKDAGSPDLNLISSLEQKIRSCNAELGNLADDREPRNAIHK